MSQTAKQSGPVKDPEVTSIKPIQIAEIGVSGVQAQIETARAFPRSVDRFAKGVRAEAMMNQQVARTMFYAKPQGQGKDPLLGPSARLAEVVARHWGNLRVESQIGEVGGKTIRAWGVGWDLETNYAVRVEVARQITTASGKRYPDHLIITTGMAAQSIARRNAVFSVVPGLFWQTIYTDVLALSTGESDAKSTGALIRAELAAWAELGVKESDVLKIANAEGKADLIGRKLAYLQGVRTSIEANELTVADVLFPERAASGAADLNALLEEQ